MFYTDDSLYPENMQPLIISAAPYAPTWLPGDAEDIAVTWDEQVQVAVARPGRCSRVDVPDSLSE